MAGPLLERFRPPRRLRATRDGKAFVLITLAVGVAAMNTGNNLLYLALSMNLSLVVLSGFLSEGSIRRVRGEVRRPSDLFAATDGRIAVRLDCGGKKGPSRSLSAILRTADGDAVAVPFPDLPPGGESVRMAPFVPRRRGPCRIVSFTLSTAFPFGLFEKSLELPLPPPLLVYPFPDRGGAAEASASEREGESRPAPRGGQGTGLAGIREHLPGDALRDVHWKASARFGRLLVKERERDRRRTATIRVELGGEGERFERELSLACGAVLERLREGSPFLLVAGDRSVPDDGGGGRRGEALALLARLRPDGSLEEDGP